MNDCASAGENQIRGCSLSRAIVAITPQHSQHLIIFVKKSVAIPNGRFYTLQQKEVSRIHQHIPPYPYGTVANKLESYLNRFFNDLNCQIKLDRSSILT